MRHGVVESGGWRQVTRRGRWFSRALGLSALIAVPVGLGAFEYSTIADGLARTLALGAAAMCTLLVLAFPVAVLIERPWNRTFDVRIKRPDAAYPLHNVDDSSTHDRNREEAQRPDEGYNNGTEGDK